MQRKLIQPLLLVGTAVCLLLPTGCGSMLDQAGIVRPVQGTVASSADKPAAPQPATRSPVFPLTGLPSGTQVHTRPIMVMVENSPQARPQSGLDKADLVYEILAEGEITRFVAVYQSASPKAIGPVRSIRPYFVQIGEGLDAVMVHAGWSQEAMNIIARDKLSHFDEVYGDGAYYWRSTDRKMPHNLYTSLDKIHAGMQKKNVREDDPAEVHWLYGGAGPAGSGRTAKGVTIPYLHGYQVSYSYDSASGSFLRSMDGKPHLDKETGKQLSAENVLIVEAKHRIVDEEGRRDVDVFGPGNGYLLQQGMVREVTWERKNGLIRAYSGGRELPMVPGKTWVQVVPEDTKLAWP